MTPFQTTYITIPTQSGVSEKDQTYSLNFEIEPVETSFFFVKYIR